MPQRKLAIIYYNFLDRRGTDLVIGGVETYLLKLTELARELGFAPVVFQVGDFPFEERVARTRVIGVVPSSLPHKSTRKALFDAAIREINLGEDLLIFGADHASVKAPYSTCISIQHGISWDLPADFFNLPAARYLPVPKYWQKRWTIHRAKQYFENCPNRVCVDYNFLNWYRTQIAGEIPGRTWVIPNFAAMSDCFVPTIPRPWAKPVKIIFAGRFVEHRGTRLMEQVISVLLAGSYDLLFTLAGEGPDLLRLEQRFAGEQRVRFMRYSPLDAVRVHGEHDIAVVPSVGSQGTSFSLAEAMGAGCAVVASPVGGVTNMIIDGYNGRLVAARVDELVQAIVQLIVTPTYRASLGTRAMETVAMGFGLDRWKKRWSEVLTLVAGP